MAVAAMVATAGTVAATAAHAEPAATDLAASVVSVETNADGTVTETTYTPAPEVTPTELAQLLAARGVPNVSVRRADDIGAMVAPCALGTARTWPSGTTCFVRWSYNGAVRPIIHFVDRSGASWPVGRSVTRWNTTSGIDSIYRTSCGGGAAHCVNVYSANYGATGWVGLTRRALNAAQTYYTAATVQLNDHYGGTEAQKWNTACHELGHVLGLDHNTSTASCLYRTQTSQRYPHANDHNLLERYY